MKTQCSVELLESALAGRLQVHDETSLYHHLESCEACNEALEQMSGGAAWCREAALLLGEDDLDPAVPTRDEWSEIDFTVEHLEPADEPNVLGRLGGYDVLEIIGHGGMGVVLKAFDRELKRPVAIKVLAPNLARNSLARKRFAREAQAAAAVVHPHVLAIHQVQAGGRLPFLVMPLVAGESLAERLTAQGALELKEVLRIGMQAAAGLAAAHEQGLVHRDVKPANILLEKGIERAVLTDFGLARAADDVTLTRWGIVAGTPQYMSPEQARGEPLDGRSDLFSLGCVLYEMATGVSPFRTDSVMATMRRLVDDSPQAMASLNPELPPWFIAIVDRLLDKDPARRFASANEISELLEHCLAHVQQPASVPLPEELRHYKSVARTKRDQPSIRKLLAGAAFAALLLFAGVVIVLELNKGTLTIESVADDVALRITQGDKVVEELTVTQAGKQVRIAAGTYVVEIDGKADGIAVKDGNVTIARGGTDIVKIVRSDAAQSRPALPYPAHPPRPSPGDVPGQDPRTPANPSRNAANGDPNQDPGKPTAPTAADPPPPPAGVLTTSQVVEQGNALYHSRKKVTVRFRVESVTHVTLRDEQDKESKRWNLSSKAASDRVDPTAFSVLLSPEAEAALDRRGVSNIARHYFGRLIEVEGVVYGVGLELVSQPETIWTYHMDVDSLEQIRVVDSASDQPSATGGSDRRAEPPGFSETKEVVLSMNSSKFMLDLDTGNTMDPPARTGRPEQGQMDIYTDQVQPYHYPKELIGYELKGLEVKASDWNASAADVRRALAGDNVGPLKQMDLGPEKNPTYFFKTRDGAQGILQLLGLVDEPKGIRLRYKTLAIDPGSNRRSSAATFHSKLSALLDQIKRREDSIERISYQGSIQYLEKVDTLRQAGESNEAFIKRYTSLTPKFSSVPAFPLAVIRDYPADVGHVKLGDILLETPKYMEYFFKGETVTQLMGVEPGRCQATITNIRPPELSQPSETMPRMDILTFRPVRDNPLHLAIAKAATTKGWPDVGGRPLFHLEKRVATDSTDAWVATFMHQEPAGDDRRQILWYRIFWDSFDGDTVVTRVDELSVTGDSNAMPVTVMLLEDYRKLGSLHVPFRVRMFRFGNTFLLGSVLNLSGVKVNDAVTVPANLQIPPGTSVRDMTKGENYRAAESSPPKQSNAAPKRIDYFTTGHSVTVACSADGKRIAVANGNPTRILQTNSGSRVQGGWKPTADILDAETGKVIVSLKLTTADEDAIVDATKRISHVEATALAFSPEGQLVAVGTSIGQVKLFNAQTGEPVRTLDDPARLADKDTPENWKPLVRAMGSVSSLAFSPDGTLLATCGGSFREFSDIFDGVQRLGRSDSVSGPGRLKLWDLKTGKLKHDLVGHGGNASAVAFSQDTKSWNLLASAGSWLASDGSGHGTGVIIWNPYSGQKIRTIAREANGGTHSVMFSRSGERVAIGSWRYDKENDKSTMAVSLTNATSGITEWEQDVPGGASLKAFSPDGANVLVLAGQSIRFLDAKTGQVKREIKSENLSKDGRWTDFAVASKGSRVVIGAVDGEEGSVEVWDFPDAPAAATPKHVRHFPTGAEAKSIAYSADGKLIALAYGDLTQPMAPAWKRSAGILDTETGTVVPLNLSTAEEDAALAATEGLGHFETLGVSPKGDVVAVGTSLGQIKLFNPRTGELIRTLDDEKARLADKATPEKFKSLKRALGSVASLAFSPDGSLLATCGQSFADTADVFDRIERSRLPVTDAGRLKVWDVKTGTLKHDLVGHSQAYAVAFSADGTILASAGKWTDGGHDNGVIIWNPETGAKVRTMVIDANGGTHHIAFSPTKKLLATASLVFDKENDTRSTMLSLAYPLSGITDWVQTIPGWAKPSFSPDGQSIAVLREGNSIRFVDVQTGQAKHELTAPRSPSAQRWRDLAIAPKANMLAVSGVEMENRGFVTLWEIDRNGDRQGAEDNGPAGEEAKLFQGDWMVVGLEGGGHKAPEAELKGQSWSVEGNTIIGTAGGSTGTMRFALNAQKSPKEIDMIALDGNRKGTTSLGIYEFQAGRLRICYRAGSTSKDRPTEFTSSQDSGCGLMTFERKPQ